MKAHAGVQALLSTRISEYEIAAKVMREIGKASAKKHRATTQRRKGKPFDPAARYREPAQQ